jgi:3-oxoacyl-[acyl-carrier protein] reductase
MSYPISLDGRVALVTGSTRGLGKAMAMALGRAGARVAMNYANDAALAERAFADFSQAGGRGMTVRADVTRPEQVDSMMRQIADRLGPVDILVPNATCLQPLKPLEQYDWEFYQTMIDFFIKSPYLLTRACLTHMKRQRWGRIINIGTEAFEKGFANFTAYVAAKGGQKGFSRSLALELAPWGITVNVVSPGWIPVERHAKDPQEEKDAYLATVPARRWGVPDDVAAAVVFLASEQAGFITGQNLNVSGGTILS